MIDVDRQRAIQRAARTFAAGQAEMLAMEPHAAADAAHYAGGLSIDEIERMINGSRSISSMSRSASSDPYGQAALTPFS